MRRLKAVADEAEVIALPFSQDIARVLFVSQPMQVNASAFPPDDRIPIGVPRSQPEQAIPNQFGIGAGLNPYLGKP